MRKLETPHTCSIPGCDKTFTKGGRAGRDGKPPICPMHYHRERRGSPRALDAAPIAPSVRRHIYLPVEIDQVLEALALERDDTPSAVIRDAVLAFAAKAEAQLWRNGRKGNR